MTQHDTLIEPNGNSYVGKSNPRCIATIVGGRVAPLKTRSMPIAKGTMHYSICTQNIPPIETKKNQCTALENKVDPLVG